MAESNGESLFDKNYVPLNIPPIDTVHVSEVDDLSFDGVHEDDARYVDGDASTERDSLSLVERLQSIAPSEWTKDMNPWREGDDDTEEDEDLRDSAPPFEVDTEEHTQVSEEAQGISQRVIRKPSVVSIDKDDFKPDAGVVTAEDDLRNSTASTAVVGASTSTSGRPSMTLKEGIESSSIDTISKVRASDPAPADAVAPKLTGTLTLNLDTTVASTMDISTTAESPLIISIMESPRSSTNPEMLPDPTITKKRLSLPPSSMIKEGSSKSEGIHRMQGALTDSQKIAYVGLSYLLAIHDETSGRFPLPHCAAALTSHELWFKAHMERLYASLELSPEERLMIRQLAEHGVKPDDVAKTLVQEASRVAARAAEECETEETPPLDIRYTLLTHLFLLNLMDGNYDARSRALLRSLAERLGVPFTPDVVDIEKAISERIRVMEDVGRVEHSGVTVVERNRKDLRGRWLALGVATLAGGAVVGVTAGLAAPLIATGIGAALTMVGVSGGVGVGAFMGGATGIAIIATGGAVTGGGMSGFKMLRRTRGISQFEFKSLADALVIIEANSKRRAEERKKRRSRRALWKRLEEGHPTLENDTVARVKEEKNSMKQDGQMPTEDCAERGATPLPAYPADEVPTGVPMVSISLDAERNRQMTVSSHVDGGGVASEAETAEALKELEDLEGSPVTVNESGIGMERPNVLKASGSLIWERSREASACGVIGEGSSDSEGGRSFRITSDCFSDGVWTPREDTTPNGEFFKDTVRDRLEDATSTPLSKGTETPSPLEISSAASKDSSISASLPSTDPIVPSLPPLQTDLTADIQPSPSPRPSPPQLNVLITVAGWVTTRDSEDDFTLPFSTLTPCMHGDQYSLVWETKALRDLGSAMKLLVGEVTSFVIQQGIQTFLLPALMAGLTGPLWVLKFTSWLDNPWALALTKAKKAGHILADTLLSNIQEGRPVTLVGFSLGARLIYYCLLELAKRGGHGIVENVYLFGCPVLSNHKEWQMISSVVSGKIVNGYLSNDWILGVLYRTSSAAAWRHVPGLRPVEGVEGMENVCLDGVVQGHMEYRTGLPRVLKHCGFMVDKEEFEDGEEEENGLGDEIKERKREKENDVEEVPTAGGPVSAEVVKPEKDVKKEEVKKEEVKKTGLRYWFFGRKGKKEVPSLSKDTTLAANAKESKVEKGKAKSLTPEEEEAAAVKDIMEQYWEPREIVSTLPPLVIDTKIDTKKVDTIFIPRIPPPPPPPGSIVLDTPSTAVNPETPDDAIVPSLTKQGSRESVGCGDIGTTPNALKMFKMVLPPSIASTPSSPVRANAAFEGEALRSPSKRDPLAPYPFPETLIKDDAPVPIIDAEIDGVDTRKREGDGGVTRWDGYQGPAAGETLSVSSSSSDIASGADMVSSMGALPILKTSQGVEGKNTGLRETGKVDSTTELLTAEVEDD